MFLQKLNKSSVEVFACRLNIKTVVRNVFCDNRADCSSRFSESDNQTRRKKFFCDLFAERVHHFERDGRFYGQMFTLKRIDKQIISARVFESFGYSQNVVSCVNHSITPYNSPRIFMRRAQVKWHLTSFMREPSELLITP